MRSFLQTIIARVLHYSGLNSLCGFFLRDKIFVIGYHSIGRSENKAEFSGELYENLSVPAREFDAQIAFLKKHGHTFITFSELPRVLKDRPSKPTLIYFDDGFKDNPVNALPILQKYGAPATVFISTGLIDRTHFLWTLKHRYFLRKNNVLPDEIEKAIVGLKSLSTMEREKRLTEEYGAADFIFNPADFNVFLNWDDARQLAENGWEIGAHGVAHGMLTEREPEMARAEVFDAARAIKEKIGKNVVSFSFPYGRFSDKILALTRSGGYRFIVSSGAGVNDPAAFHGKSYFLKTIGARPHDSLPDFSFRLYAKNLIKRLL